MSYVYLGSRVLKATADQTGQNAGNWTASFTPALIAVSTQIPYFEVYHISITGGQPGASLKVYVDINQWDTTLIGWQNSWDPAQPLGLQQGNYLNFFWSDAVSDNTPATCTIWLRYDPSQQLYGKAIG